MAIRIEKQPDGKYKIRVWARNLDAFGKRKTKQKSNIRTVAVAEREAKIMEDKLSDEEYQDDITFKELDELYMQTKSSRMSPTTVLYANNSLRPVINKFMGNAKVKNINTRMMQQLVDKLEKTENKIKPGQKISKATVRHYVSHVHAVLNWGVANDYLEFNRVKRLEYQEDEEPFEPTILEPEKIKDVLLFLKNRYYNLYIPVLIYSNTGARRGEGLGVKEDAINLEKDFLHIRNQTIQVGKEVFDKSKLKTSSSRRYLGLSDFVKAEIIAHKNMTNFIGNDYLCSNVFMGKAPKPDYVTKMFHKIMKSEFGIDMRLHDLRHSFNQIGYEEEIELKEMSGSLGHSKTKTTKQVYTSFSIKKSKAAMNTISKRILG